MWLFYCFNDNKIDIFVEELLVKGLRLRCEYQWLLNVSDVLFLDEVFYKFGLYFCGDCDMLKVIDCELRDVNVLMEIYYGLIVLGDMVVVSNSS